VLGKLKDLCFYTSTTKAVVEEQGKDVVAMQFTIGTGVRLAKNNFEILVSTCGFEN